MEDRLDVTDASGDSIGWINLVMGAATLLPMYLEAFRDVLARQLDKGPLVVAGDFNQSLDGRGAPAHVREALWLTLEPG